MLKPRSIKTVDDVVYHMILNAFNNADESLINTIESYAKELTRTGSREGDLYMQYVNNWHWKTNTYQLITKRSWSKNE